MPPTDLIYAGTSDGIVFLHRFRGAWKPTERTLEGQAVRALLVGEARPTWMLAATDRGIWRSTDGGGRWEQTLEGNAYALALDPRDPERIYAGLGEPPALYRSEDGGGTWTHLEALERIPQAASWGFPLPADRGNARVRTVLVPWSGEEVLVGVEVGGIFASADGGETWQDRSWLLDPDIHVLVADPTQVGRLYVATGVGVYYSQDAGRSWEPRRNGLLYRYLTGLAWVDGSPPTLVAAAASAPPSLWREGGPFSALYLSEAQGRLWEPILELKGDVPLCLASLQNRPGLVYAGTYGGNLWVSRTGGRTWIREAEGLGGQILCLAGGLI